MLTSGVLLLYDNAHLHMSIASCTPALLEHFSWEFDHSPSSPNLTLSNYHLFTYPKNWFSNIDMLMEGVKTPVAADWFDDGIQKLIPRRGNCLNSCSDYNEK
jgi:hypothetical protein